MLTRARSIVPPFPRSPVPSFRRSGVPSGFTLLELLAALAISGLVFLLASRLLSVAIGSSSALREARTALDREQNGYRWLRSAFGSLDLSAAPGGFEGQPDRIRFGSWRPSPAGWPVPRGVSLALVDGALLGQEDSDPPIRLADSVAALAVDYLLEPGADTRWVRQWISPLTAPVAVRLRIARRAGQTMQVDTLLLLIGERG